jgi:hypothetical protein
MTDHDGPKSARGTLPVEVIDELGRVLDTVYVGEITGNAHPVISRGRRSEQRRITREE